MRSLRLLKVLGALTVIKKKVSGRQRRQVRDRLVISAAGRCVCVSVPVCVTGATDSVANKGNGIIFFFFFSSVAHNIYLQQFLNFPFLKKEGVYLSEI